MTLFIMSQVKQHHGPGISTTQKAVAKVLAKIKVKKVPCDTLLLNEHFLLSMVHTQYEQPFVESNSTLRPTFYKNKFVFCFIFFHLNSLPNNCVPVH